MRVKRVVSRALWACPHYPATGLFRTLIRSSESRQHRKSPRQRHDGRGFPPHRPVSRSAKRTMVLRYSSARFHSRMTSKFVVPSPNWSTHPCVQQPYIVPSHRWPEDILNFALAKNSARNVAFGSWPCENAWRKHRRAAISARWPCAVIFPDWRLFRSGSAPEADSRRLERFCNSRRTRVRDDYALITAMSGWTPKMFMTRVRL